jgi:hypothetical protein
MRCDKGRALCGMVDEIRTSLQLESPGQLVRAGRPESQLTHARKLLEDHDAGCWQCRNGSPDAA